MKPKHVVTVVLLLFVVGSVAYMIVQERRAAAETPETTVPEAQSRIELQPVLPTDENPETAQQPRQVVVYYFHGDVRCPTCHKLESYAQEAVETTFAEELGAGLVQWKPVNVDRPENAHFVKDYQLVTKSVILSEVIDGRETAWKNLDKIWDLVGSRDVYLDYIRENVKTFLEQDRS